MNETQLRQIWLCADDYGISPAVSAAIRELIARRRINAASVMVVTPSFSGNEATALRDAAGVQPIRTLNSIYRRWVDLPPVSGPATLTIRY